MSDERTSGSGTDGYGSTGYSNTGYGNTGYDANGYGANSYREAGASQPGAPGAQNESVNVPAITNSIFDTGSVVPTSAPRGMDFTSIVQSQQVTPDSYTTDGDNAVDVKRRSLLNEKMTNGRRVELIVSLVLAIAGVAVHAAMNKGEAGVVTALVMYVLLAWLCFSLVRVCFQYDLAFVTGLRRAVIIVLAVLGVASLAGVAYNALDVPGLIHPSTTQLTALQVRESDDSSKYSIVGKASDGSTMMFRVDQSQYNACNTGLSGVDTKYRSAQVSYLPHSKTITALSCGSSKQ